MKDSYWPDFTSQYQDLVPQDLKKLRLEAAKLQMRKFRWFMRIVKSGIHRMGGQFF